MKVNRKIIWISAGVVLLVGFSLAVFLLVRGISSFNVAQGQFDVTLKDYKDLYDKSKPFPSNENLRIEKNNIDTIQDWIVKLIEVLKRKQIDPDPQSRNPTSFINLLGEKQKSLQNAAKVAGTTMRDVKDGFAAGFEKYTQGGVLPAADDVPRLTQQVAIIEAICNILFEEKVKEIVTVRRQEFDGAAIVAAPKSRPGAGRNRTGGAAPATTRTARNTTANSYRVANAPWGGEQKDAGEFQEKELYTRMKFLIEFKARESSILNILNRFASSEMFMVVTSVDIETEPETGLDSTVSGKANKAGGLDGGALVMVTNAPVVPSGPMKNRPRTDRIIMGTDLEKAATVKIEIDVYRFRDEKDAG